MAAVLALAAAAVVAGMKGYTAISGWVKDVPPPVLADLYMRAGARCDSTPSRRLSSSPNSGGVQAAYFLACSMSSFLLAGSAPG